MSNGIRIILPWPPSVNHYWRRVGDRTVISAEGRAYRNAAAWSIRAAHANLELIGPLAVEILLHPPDRRRRDIDNSLKALLDAMQAGGVYADDSQIDYLCVSREEPMEGGQVRVTVREYKK